MNESRYSRVRRPTCVVRAARMRHCEFYCPAPRPHSPEALAVALAEAERRQRHLPAPTRDKTNKTPVGRSSAVATRTSIELRRSQFGRPGMGEQARAQSIRLSCTSCTVGTGTCLVGGAHGCARGESTVRRRLHMPTCLRLHHSSRAIARCKDLHRGATRGCGQHSWALCAAQLQPRKPRET